MSPTAGLYELLSLQVSPTAGLYDLSLLSLHVSPTAGLYEFTVFTGESYSRVV